MNRFFYVSLTLILVSSSFCFSSENYDFGLHPNTSYKNGVSNIKSNPQEENGEGFAKNIVDKVNDGIDKKLMENYTSCFKLFGEDSRKNLIENKDFIENAIEGSNVKSLARAITYSFNSNNMIGSLGRNGFKPVDDDDRYILVNEHGVVARSKSSKQIPPFGGMNICMYRKYLAEQIVRFQDEKDINESKGRNLYTGLLTRNGQKSYLCDIQNELCKVAFLKNDKEQRDEDFTYRWVPSHRGQVAEIDEILKYFAGQEIYNQYWNLPEKGRVTVDKKIEDHIMELGHHKFKGVRYHQGFEKNNVNTNNNHQESGGPAKKSASLKRDRDPVKAQPQKKLQNKPALLQRKHITIT